VARDASKPRLVLALPIALGLVAAGALLWRRALRDHPRTFHAPTSTISGGWVVAFR